MRSEDGTTIHTQVAPRRYLKVTILPARIHRHDLRKKGRQHRLKVGFRVQQPTRPDCSRQ